MIPGFISGKSGPSASVSAMTVDMGAETLTGTDHGVNAPDGATSITGGTQSSAYTMDSGAVYPDVSGTVPAGTLEFDNGVTWTINPVENEYNVRTEDGYADWIAEGVNDTVCQIEGEGTAFMKWDIAIRIDERRVLADNGYGRFHEVGDFWAEGGYSVESQTAANSVGTASGAMLDIDDPENEGFTPADGRYDSALNVALSLPVEMDDSEIHSYVAAVPQTAAAGGASQVIRRMHVLTSIPSATVPSMTSTMMRPGAFGDSTRILLDWDDFDTDIFAGDTKPTGTPYSLDTDGTIGYGMGSPFMNIMGSDSGNGWSTTPASQQIAARYHAEYINGNGYPYHAYPRELGYVINEFMVMANSDDADAMRYAARVAQFGLDFLACWIDCTNKRGILHTAGFGCPAYDVAASLVALGWDNATFKARVGAAHGSDLGILGYFQDGDDYRTSGYGNSRILWGDQDSGGGRRDTSTSPPMGETQPASGYTAGNAATSDPRYRLQWIQNMFGAVLAIFKTTGMAAEIDALYTPSATTYLKRYALRVLTEGASDSDETTLTQNAWDDWADALFGDNATLSSPAASDEGSGEASGNVDCDIDNGTLYVYASTTTTSPSVSDHKDGTSSLADPYSQLCGSTGQQDTFDNLTNISPQSGVYLHYYHEDVFGNGSNQVYAGPITVT